MPDIPTSYLWQATLVMFLVTFGLRGFVFAAFGGDKKPPKLILYVGSVISPAIIAALIVYCFRNAQPLQAPYAIPEIAATLCCVLLHLWKRNPLISIIGSTAVYMCLIQDVFNIMPN